MELISREALLDVIDKERKYLLARGQTGAEHILVHNFRELAINAPTVCEMYGDIPEYNERPQGKWELRGMIYYCSNCGKDCEQGGNNYCGQCGAKMQTDDE
jgi:hypothetical protein